jgi:hypothetical protein
VVLALAERHGRRADFELPSGTSRPGRSIDVALRDDAARSIIVVEIWNRLDDVGAAARSRSRKAWDADGLAVLAGRDGPPYRVSICWLLVDSVANRRLVARYPAILRARFPGSSAHWAHCLVEGTPAPERSRSRLDRPALPQDRPAPPSPSIGMRSRPTAKRFEGGFRR